jgi:hypothetical protein
VEKITAAGAGDWKIRIRFCCEHDWTDIRIAYGFRNCRILFLAAQQSQGQKISVPMQLRTHSGYYFDSLEFKAYEILRMPPRNHLQKVKS